VLRALASRQHQQGFSREARSHARIIAGPSPWGVQTRSSCRGLVFVEESAEEVAPPDLQRMNSRCGRRIGSAAAVRRSQVERSVWTLLVEVADVDAEDVLELAAAEDQEPVEALPPDASDPAFRVRARVRCLDRRPDDLDALAAEDAVDGAAELRVAVVDQEPRPPAAVVEVDQYFGISRPPSTSFGPMALGSDGSRSRSRASRTRLLLGRLTESSSLSSWAASYTSQESMEQGCTGSPAAARRALRVRTPGSSAGFAIGTSVLGVRRSFCGELW
jgi:hypothetical protein